MIDVAAPTAEAMRLDPLTVEERGRRMALVRGRDTKPELCVRRLVHGLGYRYRLCSGRLPGRPDLVFSSRRKVIFVHGCFWHQHPSALCKLARMPKSRLEFWKKKLLSNRERDQVTLRALGEIGWNSLVVWECQLREVDDLKERIRSFLES